MSQASVMPERPIWFITGCSSGFGLSLTRHVQSNGHTVIATSRNPSRTPELVAEVEAKGGKWLQLDVDDRNCGHVLEEVGPVDILVNNAGGSIHGCVEQLTEDEIRQQMETLYFGPCRLIRTLVPYMRKRRFGIVVNMSSGAGLEGRESMGSYAPAKAALDNMSKILAKEVAEFNIRVLTVSLGSFNTNMTNASKVARNPMPDDYKGSSADIVTKAITGGHFEPDGDREKAMKAVYDVVMGQGVGAGHESERFLPLGRDVAARLQQVQTQYAHSMEVFGGVCNSVSK